jgi:hypothetical protein
MGEVSHLKIASVALLGGAIVLMGVGCDEAAKQTVETNDEKIISRTVRNMEVLWSENGSKIRLMSAPIMEEHSFAPDPFEEFMQGIEVVGYDSLGKPSSLVISDYALHWIEHDLWELNGNVLVEGEEGQRLYTQQLRWDRKIKKIYSNVDSKVEDGGDVLYGVGFDAADDFSRWTFNGVTGTVGVEMESNTPPADSTGVATTEIPAPPAVTTEPPAAPSSGSVAPPALSNTSATPAPATPPATLPVSRAVPNGRPVERSRLESAQVTELKQIEED